MFKERRKSHELSERHYRQVLCRPAAIREQMNRIWGITWRPGGRSGSFLGKLYRPLGSPLMMVQVSHLAVDGRGGIALYGVAAQIHPQDGAVSYDCFRMKHDFHRLPFVGAHGRTLDPSDERPGQRAHGSWVRLALDVDRARHRALSRGWLPATPHLPEVFFGYHRKEDAPFEVTPALRRRAYGGEESTVSGNFSTAVATAREQAFLATPEKTQEALLRAAWSAAFIPPSDPGNSTGLWLLPQELSRNVFATVQVFEYFGNLVGAHIFNPARRLTGRSVRNPAVELAKEVGIDLVADLTLLAGTAAGAPEFAQIEERLVGLIPAFRQRIGASEAICDQDLLNAICQYDRPVTIEPTLQSLAEVEQVRVMREQLNPQHSECCSDEDLLAAVREPNGPLMASGLCRIQALHRDPRLRLAESLSFSPESFGRDRMQASLWPYELSNTKQGSSAAAAELTIAA